MAQNSADEGGKQTLVNTCECEHVATGGAHRLEEKVPSMAIVYHASSHNCRLPVLQRFHRLYLLNNISLLYLVENLYLPVTNS